MQSVGETSLESRAMPFPPPMSKATAVFVAVLIVGETLIPKSVRLNCPSNP